MDPQILFVPIALALLVLSVPLHELAHLLFMKGVFGKTTKFNVIWLRFHFSWKERKFEVHGLVEPENEHLTASSFWMDHVKFLGFMIGLSGGLGVAILFSFGLLFPLFVPSVEPYLLKPLVVVIVFHTVCAIKEGLESVHKFKISEKTS